MSTQVATESRWLSLMEGHRLAAAAAACPGDWILESPRLAPVLAVVRRVATTPAVPVIVTGERGVGVNELCRLLHSETIRTSPGRLWTVPASGAGRPSRRGEFGSGTLVVDDVENLRPEAQRWLMEVVGDQGGAGRAIRVVATSQLEVGQLLAHPGLAQELVHALDVVRLYLPPLRHRPEEILPTAERYLRHFARAAGRSIKGFTGDAQTKLLTHPYPANVRELRNAIERAVALEISGEIQSGSVIFHDERSGADSAALNGGSAAGARLAPARIPRLSAMMQGARLPSLAEVEREYLIVLIRRLRGRRTLISRAMGVSYPTVVKRIAQHGLDVRAILAAEDESRGQAGPANFLRVAGSCE